MNEKRRRADATSDPGQALRTALPMRLNLEWTAERCIYLSPTDVLYNRAGGQVSAIGTYNYSQGRAVKYCASYTSVSGRKADSHTRKWSRGTARFFMQG